MNGLFVLVPIMVLGLGVSAIISSSILKMQRLRFEEAKLRAGNPADLEEVVRQVSDLQHEMAELQERVDFTERMLAQARETPALPASPETRLLP
jgi:Tfp pilus assembly protein PilO